MNTPARRRGRPPLREPTARRAAVLAAATEAFAADGRHGATVEAVARRAGVAKASLYEDFPTKDALYDAAVGAAADDLVDSLLRAYSRAENLPARERTRARYAAVFEHARLRPAGMRLLLLASRDAGGELATRGPEARERVLGHLTTTLDTELAAAGLRPPRPARLLATLFFGMAEAALRAVDTDAALDADAVLNPDAVVELLTELTLGGLAHCDPRLLRAAAPSEVRP